MERLKLAGTPASGTGPSPGFLSTPSGLEHQDVSVSSDESSVEPDQCTHREVGSPKHLAEVVVQICHLDHNLAVPCGEILWLLAVCVRGMDDGIVGKAISVFCGDLVYAR
jgi:hypothetical protein